MPRDDYEERREARIDKYEDRARKARDEAGARFGSHANETLRAMGGEPIKVGHHSEKRHRRLIEKADNDMRMVALTSEQEGIGLVSGAWLGGERGALLMQSSGVGNCVNAIASLSISCRFPLLMLVTMRGEAGEFNPWQLPMGENTAELLRLTGAAVSRVEEAGDVGPAVAAGARAVFGGPAGGAAAVLIAQSLVGTKTFGK